MPGLTEEDGKLYYYDENGKKKTGFQIVDGKRYYFDKKTGEAKYGLINAGNGYTYYFLEGGKWLTGLQEIDGKWYNFAGTGGVLPDGEQSMERNTILTRK